ncbi:MAG: HAD family hydrolase [Deinococcales bacterium]
MLFAFDLDGTIINHNYQIGAKVLETLSLLKAEGHHVAVITGRSVLAVSPYPEITQLCDYVAFNHGAIVRDAAGKTIQQSFLPEAIATHVQEHRYDLDDEASLHAQKRCYVRNPEHVFWQWSRLIGYELLEHGHYQGEKLDKLAVHSSSTKLLNQLQEEYKQLSYYHWQDIGFEVVGAKGNKGEALSAISRALGVAQKDTIAFGDGVNDVEMLAWAGRGIAVGERAYQGVLQVADERVASPEEGGVVRWLRAKFL